ncbi:MAG: HNH endonuclease [Bdellovibrio sp.]|nr:HNH endonuclease [Bdellovibrio sp.]
MKKLFAGVLLFVSFNVSASDLFALGRSGDTFNYAEYYQVQENHEALKFNLLTLTQIKQKFPLPTTPYNRLAQFGTWIHGEDRCLNTRAEVLKRDSKVNVSFTASGCSVSDGKWTDPYSGKSFASAADIQIDHFVPLKNAYMTGAFEWDSKKRCLYANYMGNNFHLLSVSGRENLVKSDNSPTGYIPPNPVYVCQYLKQWLEVKLIWSLRMTPEEVTIIKQKAAEAQCDTNVFLVSATELQAQRRYIADHADLCHSR